MKTRYINEIKVFWIIYVVLLFLFTLGFLLPNDSDIIWIWVWFFFMPFSMFIIYLYGFFMGVWIQHKLNCTTKELLFLTIIYFILHFFLFIIWCLDGILRGVLYYIEAYFYPALGSTLLFLLGAFLAKWIQKRKI